MLETLPRIAFALSAALAATACFVDDEYPEPPVVQASIAGTVHSTPELHTFLTSVYLASENDDLTNTLTNPGSLTVFAPTNDAFDALAIELSGNGAARGVDLMTVDNKPLLRSVLQYHLVAGQLGAADLPRDTPITTVGGHAFEIGAGSPAVIVDARSRLANITTENVLASNGVIHVTDTVLLPPE